MGEGKLRPRQGYALLQKRDRYAKVVNVFAEGCNLMTQVVIGTRCDYVAVPASLAVPIACHG